MSTTVSFKRYFVALAVFTTTIAGCNSHDSDYFPYAMKGLNVHVYDNENSREYFGGFVEANYLAREDGLARCGGLAAATATQHHLNSWSYVCCTVTSSSSCETKVR